MPSQAGRLERVVECVARAREYVTHLRHRLSRLVAVVARGVDVVIAQLRARVAAPWIVAVDDRVVLAALDPTLQLGGANGSERVRLEGGVDHLPDTIREVALRFVRLGLLEERLEADLVIAGAATTNLQKVVHQNAEARITNQPSATAHHPALPKPPRQTKRKGNQRHAA